MHPEALSKSRNNVIVVGFFTFELGKIRLGIYPRLPPVCSLPLLLFDEIRCLREKESKDRRREVSLW